jgi:hypothetical protein
LDHEKVHTYEFQLKDLTGFEKELNSKMLKMKEKLMEDMASDELQHLSK